MKSSATTQRTEPVPHPGSQGTAEAWLDSAAGVERTERKHTDMGYIRGLRRRVTARARWLNTFLVLLTACTFALVSAAPVRAADWQARHGLSPSDYQKAFDQLLGQGYRLVNVSGYVSGGKELYAALWIKQEGPPWVARHGLSSADYQKAFDQYLEAGYRLIWINGHEIGGTARYAAIWEKKAGPAWIARHGLDGPGYQKAFDDLVNNKGYRLVHVSTYTEGGAARYAAIWNKSSGPKFQARHGLSGADYQKTFNALAKEGYRLTMVSGSHVAGKDFYAAIWQQTDGPYWMARHGIRETSYQNAFDDFYYQGYQPAFLTSFASGSAARFNAIWSNTNFKGSDLSAIRKAFDDALTATKVAGLSIAVAKDGRLVYAAGFGDADKENGIDMSVNHRLRIGSISKTVTSVAVFRLVQAHAQYGGGQTLSLDSPVFGAGGVLGSKIGVPDLLKPLKDAKIRHFLEHTSGIPSNAGDPVHCASGDLNKRIQHQLEQIKAIPADSTAVAGPVPRAPGDKFDYSNLNFIILESVIEAVSGQSYESYVRKHVFAPSQITTPRLFKIGPYDPVSGEAKHYLAGGSYAEYTPDGTCDLKPPGVGAGGWAMSAKDLLHYLTSVDGVDPGDILEKEHRDQMLTASKVWPSYARGWILQGWGSCNSGWSIVQGHNGGLSGAFADLFLLPSGMSFALIANQDPTKSGFCTPIASAGSPPPPKVACGADKQPFCGDEPLSRLVELLGKVTWPSYNLF